MKKTITISFILSLIFLSSCTSKNSNKKDIKNQSISYNTPKYIFYFIGDGMSIPQVTIADKALKNKGFRNNYNKQTLAKGSSFLSDSDSTLCFLSDFSVGMSTTNAQNRYITGSAAAVTALATGHKTTIGTLSMNGDHTKKYKTIAEMAKEKGYKVGIITSVSIDHATPAGFYAHVASRNNYEEIDNQLLNSNFDYFAGGFIRYDKFKNNTLENYLNIAKEKGYTFIDSREKLFKLNNKSGKILATIPKMKYYTKDAMALPYSIDLDIQKTQDDRTSLADFVEKGIDVLNNDKGFFLFTEGGKIDWANHSNDVVTSIMEIISFNQSIQKALEFYKKHPKETLIVITGDHECGGLTLGFAGTKYETTIDYLNSQKTSSLETSLIVKEFSKDKNMTFEKAFKYINNTFGFDKKGMKLSKYEINRLHAAYDKSMDKKKKSKNDEQKLMYGYYDPLTVTATHILCNKAGLNWSSYSHTAIPTGVYAKGQGQELFNGYYDNTDIVKKIIKIADFKSVNN